MGTLLNGGLILRSLTENPSDKHRFGEFMHTAFENDGDWRESSFVRWVNDLLFTHPMMSLEYIWCVVDPAANGKIVSGLFLIPQVWRYEDVEISVGRPEIVATLPDYRRRGLVRDLFHVLHQYSQSQGHLLNAITGIPHFYRQFGYAFTVDSGFRGEIPFSSIPKRGDDEPIRYTLRPATEADIPTLVAVDAYDAQSFLLSAIRDETMWHYELFVRDKQSGRYNATYMIVNKDDQAVGYVAIANNDDSYHLTRIWRWVIGENANYLETFEDVLRGIREICQQQRPKVTGIQIVDGVTPVITQLMQRNAGMYTASRLYAWYLRVPDHVAFIRKIQPVLERRLVGSPARGFSGRLRINFYQHEDLQLNFQQGKLADVFMTDEQGYPDARFPFDTWLNVLFGANRESEINAVLPETMTTAEAAMLLDILFPKKKSLIYPIF